MSFHWSLLFSVLYLNNWIDNIFISEVSLKIRLGNEGEIIKKKKKNSETLPWNYYPNTDKYLATVPYMLSAIHVERALHMLY